MTPNTEKKITVERLVSMTPNTEKKITMERLVSMKMKDSPPF